MTNAPTTGALKGLVVLVADGKLYSRVLLRSMLMQLEAKTVHETLDGSATIAAMSDVNPDLLIVDWELPGVSAREVLRRVRGTGAMPDLPVIVVSNSGHSADVHDAIKLGAQQFMIRPISPKMLDQRLRGILANVRRFGRGYNFSMFRAGGEPQPA